MAGGTRAVTRGHATSSTKVKTPTTRSPFWKLGNARAVAATRSRKCSGLPGTLNPRKSFTWSVAMTVAMPAVKPVVTG